jgi:hypothetical protein
MATRRITTPAIAPMRIGTRLDEEDEESGGEVSQLKRERG